MSNLTIDIVQFGNTIKGRWMNLPKSKFETEIVTDTKDYKSWNLNVNNRTEFIISWYGPEQECVKSQDMYTHVESGFHLTCVCLVDTFIDEIFQTFINAYRKAVELYQ